MIFRPDYIEAIKPFINQPLVKILAGIRRCGKSTIFEYTDAKTRYEKSLSEQVQARYEFLFRSKVLDFYNGKPLEF